ncbi:phage tail tape measure protein, partial [Escherichia coli]|nr:phage tail tape measure protein [Escherichia coli]
PAVSFNRRRSSRRLFASFAASSPDPPNLPELQRQLKLTAGNDALGSMQKESDINKDSLSAQWLLVKTGAQNTFSSLGET